MLRLSLRSSFRDRGPRPRSGLPTDRLVSRSCRCPETSIVLWSTSPRSHDSREVPNHDAPHQAMDGPMVTLEMLREVGTAFSSIRSLKAKKEGNKKKRLYIQETRSHRSAYQLY
ncbi:hypothetical protein MUK42_11154 [Musa troglodytarum]|uniref:Uncharacterized protein n=1 Tax=Musa troglodytarum TaxID=320322 RepID=A0A9E7GHC2_9LILI|nr:hypothetical protein MUK42_11154 [Musa troglodytarum]